jgi:hypothetical protein
MMTADGTTAHSRTRRWTAALVVAIALTAFAAPAQDAAAQEAIGETFNPRSDGDYLTADGSTQFELWEAAFPDLAADQDEAAFLADLMRVQRLIQRPADTMVELSAFAEEYVFADATEAGAGAVTGPDDDLVEALARMEAEAMFPTYRITVVGLLGSEEFLRIASGGFVLNDIGAGKDHGEFAHRLQWAAIIQNYKRDPSAWSYTPYELYVRIGLHDASESPSLFAHLFDRPGLDVDGAADGYRHPDRLTRDLRNMVANGNPPNSHLQKVAAGVDRRFLKRRDEITAAAKFGNAAMKLIACNLLRNGYVLWNPADPTGAAAPVDICGEFRAGDYTTKGKVLYIHGEDLDAATREIANAEVYVTMRSNRARYRGGLLSDEEYAATLEGVDPKIVDFFLAN